MNNPQLLKCEQCSTEAKTIYLGSLSSQGDLIFRNSHAKHQVAEYSCIMSDSFTLVHSCGFTIKVESGRIIQECVSPTLNG